MATIIAKRGFGLHHSERDGYYNRKMPLRAFITRRVMDTIIANRLPLGFRRADSDETEPHRDDDSRGACAAEPREAGR